ncbi:unnamed protein product [Darwinula stevensoni]|uniref:Uncharacterized protein n=1 Tax=Darwinula stevensoni TaxID=69355 RepID=A0A7R8X241_9CRUS|nr:unnamed protein product [Darwinula stevensoni]CAG0882967.1 unnamed protein product [Darwinula stevensoni]
MSDVILNNQELTNAIAGLKLDNDNLRSHITLKSQEFADGIAHLQEQLRASNVLRGTCTLADPIWTEETGEEIEKRMGEIELRPKNRRQEGLQNLERAQEKQKDAYDLKRSGPAYNVGDKVLKRNARKDTRMGGKLEERFVGPYFIREVLAKDAFLLRDDNGKDLTQKVNGSNLRRVISPIMPSAASLSKSLPPSPPPLPSWAGVSSEPFPPPFVGNKVVFLNKRDGMKDHSMFSQPGTFPRPDGEPQNGRDENVNGRRGDLSKPRVLNNAESHNPPGNSEDSCQPNYSDTGMPSIRPNARKNRERQLEALRKLEERLQTLRSVPSTESSSSNSRLPQFPKSHGEPMTLHILDVGRAISDGIVTWLPFHGFRDFHSSAPGATVMYTLSLGCNELVMFGGLLKQEGLTRDEVTNTLHFLEMPPKVP